MKKFFIPFLGVLLFFTSCKQESDPVNILVNRIDMENPSVQTGNSALFHIKAFSENSKVKKVYITSIDLEYGSMHVWDTLLDTKKAEFDYLYKAPLYTQNEETNVNLTFTAVNTEGDEVKMSLSITVGKTGVLDSYDGVIMYSALSNGRNGFNISSPQTIYTATADSSDIDIYDYFNTNTTNDSTALSYEWRSKTGLLFVRYNDFNFTDASQFSLKAAYTAGVKYTSITNLQAGDVILVGKIDEELGAIQITAIYDEEGTANDRYIFNFKKK